ncbi:MAG: hypothetical protein JOZ82_10830 [Marmoricola sp.]|nr:hypothetical protein [Marmoricola sp.]
MCSCPHGTGADASWGWVACAKLKAWHEPTAGAGAGVADGLAEEPADAAGVVAVALLAAFGVPALQPVAARTSAASPAAQVQRRLTGRVLLVGMSKLPDATPEPVSS